MSTPTFPNMSYYFHYNLPYSVLSIRHWHELCWAVLRQRSLGLVRQRYEAAQRYQSKAIRLILSKVSSTINNTPPHSINFTILTASCWIFWCDVPSYDPFRLLASPVHIAVGGLSLADATTISTEHVTRYRTPSRVHLVLSYRIFSHSTLSYPILSHYLYIKEDCYSSYRYFSILSNTLILHFVIFYLTSEGG